MLLNDFYTECIQYSDIWCAHEILLFWEKWKMIYQYNERFSFCKINVWTYFILGEADKEKAKGKKKLWWRPWVDHASSRFSQSFYK